MRVLSANLAARLRPRAPRSALGRFAAYLAALDALLYLLQQALVRLDWGSGKAFDVWLRLVSLPLALAAIILFYRWLRDHLMWRLRNRLIVTYVFIGAIPVALLLLMGQIAAYLLAAQFATSVAMSEMQSEIGRLQAVNDTLASEISSRLQRGDTDWRAGWQRLVVLDRDFPQRQVTIWADGRPVFWQGPAAIALPQWKRQQIPNIVLDNGTVHLRALTTVRERGNILVVISSIPLDRRLFGAIAHELGEVTFYLFPRPRDQNTTGIALPTDRVSADVSPAGEPRALARITAGSLPPARNVLDREITFGAPLTATDWKTGEPVAGLLGGHSRPSLLYPRLFLNLGSWANVILTALLSLAVLFGVIVLAAVLIGIRLTRTITRSVAALYEATQHINRGDFRHRIQVRTRDQLAELETSFNRMSESLEQLIAEQKEKQRMEGELAIAQEVQAQLFPRQAPELRALEVHGVCRPARTVSGDYFDFLPRGPERLGIAIGDISGKGISAALLMATLHSAVRAYEFDAHLIPAAGGQNSGGAPRRQPVNVGAGVGQYLARAAATAELASPNGMESPARVMWLLNRHLYQSTPPEKYATLFLGLYDGDSHILRYTNAGHLPPLLLGSDGGVRKLDTAGLVIGLFDDVPYEERNVELHAGDIFVAFSDGITEPENEFGEFGEQRLLDLVTANRHLPLARISEAALSAVLDWIGAAEQPDDVTLVLARAR